MSKYPEHEKLEKVKDKSQACGEFLEWLLGPRGYQLGEYHEHVDDCWLPNENQLDGRRRMCGMDAQTIYPVPLNVRKLLAEFFEIDEDKLDKEKRAMLDELRAGASRDQQAESRMAPVLPRLDRLQDRWQRTCATRRARCRIHRLARVGRRRIDQEAKGATTMTIWGAYHRAAKLAQSHLVADARVAAIDIATARRARLSTPSTDWRSCGPRAARVTMDRGFAAAIARIEARDRMLFDPFAAEEERKIREGMERRRVARLQ